MVKQSDVIVTRRHDSSLECSIVVNGVRKSMIYYGFTKREAVRGFTAELNLIGDTRYDSQRL